MAKANIPSTSFDPDSVVSGSVKKALESADATKGDMYFVDSDKLRVIPGFNVRIETPDYLEHVENVALSMMANGYFPNKPLGGYAGKEDGEDVIYVTDGHTRRRAIVRAREMGAELGKIPVVLKPAGTSIEDLTVALVQDNEGRPLSAMEKAIVAARLKGFNMSNAEIASRFGCTDRYVEDLLVLAAAPQKVRAFVISGKVSPTEAIKQVRKNAERAGDVLMVAVQTAAAAGKTKASAKHVKAAKASGGSTTEKFSFGWKNGQIVEVAEVLPVARLGDGWWQFTDDEKTHVEILGDVTISASVTVEKPVTVSDDEDIRVDGPTEPQAAPTAPKAKAAAPKAPKAAPKAPSKPAKAKAAPKAPAKPAAAPAEPSPVADPDASEPVPAEAQTDEDFSGL